MQEGNSETGELDFDATPSIGIREEDATATSDRVPEPVAWACSAALVLTALGLAYGCSRFLARASRHTAPSGARTAPAWHALSLLTASFLGMNVFFGGLTAFLLNGSREDARGYFANLSPLKLARLSHEHFFGYAVLFGAVSALCFFFVGAARKRVLLPMAVAFSFAALDVASWWLARYLGFGFHALSVATGFAFAAAFVVLYVQLAVANVRGILASNPRE